MIGSDSLNCPFTSRIEIPTLFRTFSTSFRLSPVSESTNLPALIWFILERILFKPVPIESSLSCVTSLIVAIMAAVFSRLTPALFACDATFVSACPIPPASEADSKSILVSTSLICPAWSAFIWKPFRVAVNTSDAFSESICASLDSTILSLISWLVSDMERPCLNQLSADFATSEVILPSSCPNAL